MPRQRTPAEQAAEDPAPAVEQTGETEEPIVQAEAENPPLFIAVTSAMGAVNVRRGEVAVQGAEILRTHPSLFKPLAITYKA
jgi:hypothetical protein